MGKLNTSLLSFEVVVFMGTISGCFVWVNPSKSKETDVHTNWAIMPEILSDLIAE